MPRPSWRNACKQSFGSHNLCAHKELMPHWQSWGIPNAPVATWGFCLNLKPYDAALSATLACEQTLARTREAQEGGCLVGLWGLLYRADRYSAQGSTRERFFVENRMVENDQKTERKPRKG